MPRFFAVGSLCIHVEGSVAALATQVLANPMHAVHARPRLRGGEARKPHGVGAAALAGYTRADRSNPAA